MYNFVDSAFRDRDLHVYMREKCTQMSRLTRVVASSGHRIIMIWMLCSFLLAGCYRKVCPAYVSAFVLDDSVRQSMFALFGEDSLPLPPPKVKKDKNGLIAYVSDRRKRRRMRTIRACKVYPIPTPQPEEVEETINPLEASDSLSIANDSATDPMTDSLNIAQETGLDSLNIAQQASLAPSADSLGTEGLLAAVDSATQYRYGYRPSDNFNVEQVFYNKYFGHLFIEKEGQQSQDTTQTTVEEEFDIIPDAYVEGEFEEDLEEEAEEGEFEEDFEEEAEEGEFEEDLEEETEEGEFEEDFEEETEEGEDLEEETEEGEDLEEETEEGEDLEEETEEETEVGEDLEEETEKGLEEEENLDEE